jgi:hypothetical protein
VKWCCKGRFTGGVGADPVCKRSRIWQWSEGQSRLEMTDAAHLLIYIGGPDVVQLQRHEPEY